MNEATYVNTLLNIYFVFPRKQYLFNIKYTLSTVYHVGLSI